jgi:hypothetical protein
MKVKLYVCRHEEIEVEIDDKFRKLAVPYPWEDTTITGEDCEECIKAVEEASGLPFGEEYVDDSNGTKHYHYHENFIETVSSVENGELMLEY